jgi:hypothetical protein
MASVAAREQLAGHAGFLDEVMAGLGSSQDRCHLFERADVGDDVFASIDLKYTLSTVHGKWGLQLHVFGFSVMLLAALNTWFHEHGGFALP